MKAISLKLHPVCIQCGVLTQSSTNILSTSDEESNKGKYKKKSKKFRSKIVFAVFELKWFCKEENSLTLIDTCTNMWLP